MPGEGFAKPTQPPSPSVSQHRLFLGPGTAVLLHSQQQDLLLRSPGHSLQGQSRAKQMGLSPGGSQGSSVRGEKVHQDSRELLEPGERNRNLPRNTPPIKPLHTSLGTRNPKPREREFLPRIPTMRHFPACLWLLSTGCLGSDIAPSGSRACVCVGKGLQRIPGHIPFVCFMAAGIARGSKVQGEVAGKCPRLFQDVPGLMVKQPRVSPALPAPGHCQSELGAGTSTPGTPSLRTAPGGFQGVTQGEE